MWRPVASRVYTTTSTRGPAVFARGCSSPAGSALRASAASAAVRPLHSPALGSRVPALLLCRPPSRLSRTTAAAAATVMASPGGGLCTGRRHMFVQTVPTPNPESLKFLVPDTTFLEDGTLEFTSARDAMCSPLARSLFRIEGVRSVMMGVDFISVNKTDETIWLELKPHIYEAIQEFFASGEPILDPKFSGAEGENGEGGEHDSEVVLVIKELLDTRIRPAVQDDGGDIQFKGFDEDHGVVYLKMQGSCAGCPSSSVTLKYHIERMLAHWVAEVNHVVQVDEGEDEVSRAQLQRLEERLEGDSDDAQR